MFSFSLYTALRLQISSLIYFFIFLSQSPPYLPKFYNLNETNPFNFFTFNLNTNINFDKDTIITSHIFHFNSQSHEIIE